MRTLPAAELSALLGDRFTTGSSIREQHGRDGSVYPEAPPDAVVFPESTAEVAQLLRICAAARTPVVCYGVGTSLEGHVLATHGGVCIDMSRMNRIVAVRVDDLDATVQAGVTRSELNAALEREGLFFPVDPGADATLGGMAATGASGTTTVRYGAMRENVLALEVVLAGGEVVRTARRARKSAAGYDLTRLFVGSEGTLGVITEVTVRVYGLPEERATAVCSFETLHAAVETATRVLQTGVPVARMELLDDDQVRAVNARSHLGLPEMPMLLFEFHGAPAAVDADARAAGELALQLGAVSFDRGVGPQEAARIWRARHDAYHASLGLRPGARPITTDVCVPISRLAECIEATKADLAPLDIPTTVVGHVGDGNFHVMLMVDPDDDAEMEAARRINRRLVARALEMDGTCTGEHGIGLGKIASLAAELPEGVRVMRAVKDALDPLGILNPGKVLPA